jgi:hypothetical protein
MHECNAHISLILIYGLQYWDITADKEEEEAGDVSLSFYEFLEELDAMQEGEVPPADL